MQHPIFGTGVNAPLGRSDPSKASLAAKYFRQAISYAIPRDLITQQLLAGYGNPGITTRVVGDYRTGFAVTDGINTALTPYSFNLTKSRQLLQAAGYFPTAQPSIWQTWGFAITVMLLATVVTLAALYRVEVTRNQAKRSSPSTPPSSFPSSSATGYLPYAGSEPNSLSRISGRQRPTENLTIDPTRHAQNRFAARDRDSGCPKAVRSILDLWPAT